MMTKVTAASLQQLVKQSIVKTVAHAKKKRMEFMLNVNVPKTFMANIVKIK